jgi:hypothetical protein
MTLRIFGIAGLAAVVSLMSSSPSFAFDLDGAWTTNASACDKIFEKGKDGKISIKSGSIIHGDSFVVRGKTIFNNAATCTIKAQKEAGSVHQIVAVCAPGNVALSTFQFSYRVNDDNSIVRIFPGIEELDVTYHRCTK